MFCMWCSWTARHWAATLGPGLDELQHLKEKKVDLVIYSIRQLRMSSLSDLHCSMKLNQSTLTIRPSGKSERGYNWRDLHAAKHVNIPVNVPDGCALIRIYVPHLPWLSQSWRRFFPACRPESSSKRFDPPTAAILLPAAIHISSQRPRGVHGQSFTSKIFSSDRFPWLKMFQQPLKY